MFFGPQQQQQQSPAMFGAGMMNPDIMNMLMAAKAQMAQSPDGRSMMPMQGMNPVNVPQQGLQPGQMPQMGAGPSSQMNPLASIIGNQGGAVSPQGGMGMDAGSAGQGNGLGGLMQIINAMKSQQQVNGAQAPQTPPGGLDIMSIIKAMQGG